MDAPQQLHPEQFTTVIITSHPVARYQACLIIMKITFLASA
ncbi:MAG: hypothetical protein QNJ70_09960 [Xenococcaceae cyanobacterium MO_207.B15]|nr:hypothetical protein [Xenococcaceae cyanobacterium MO_207.B15]